VARHDAYFWKQKNKYALSHCSIISGFNALFQVKYDERVKSRDVEGFVKSSQARCENPGESGVRIVRQNDEGCSATQHPDFFTKMSLFNK